MAPQLTVQELDDMQAWQSEGFTPPEIQGKLETMRARNGTSAPHVSNVRRALQGKTHKRSATETRGRKCLIGPKQVRAMNRMRKYLV